MENAIRLIRSNEQCTPTQISLASIDASVSADSLDVLAFCNEKGIDTSDFLATARLFQIASSLKDFWNSCEQNNENMDELRDPSVLYKRVVNYLKAQGGR